MHRRRHVEFANALRTRPSLKCGLDLISAVGLVLHYQPGLLLSCSTGEYPSACWAIGEVRPVPGCGIVASGWARRLFMYYHARLDAW